MCTSNRQFAARAADNRASAIFLSQSRLEFIKSMVRGAGYVANSTNAVKKTWKGMRELEFYLGRSPALEIGELNRITKAGLELF